MSKTKRLDFAGLGGIITALVLAFVAHVPGLPAIVIAVLVGVLIYGIITAVQRPKAEG